jgi:hypothetical protein
MIIRHQLRKAPSGRTLLKILAYLLENDVHSYEGQSKRAVEFFESKIEDAMLLADVKRAVASETDVILFNIDSRPELRQFYDQTCRD